MMPHSDAAAPSVQESRWDPAVLHEVLRDAVALLAADSGSVYHWDATAGLLRCIANWQVPARDTTPDHRAGEGMAGRVFISREPLIVNDYQTWEHAAVSGIRGGLRAVVGAPLIRQGRPLGVVLIRSYDGATSFSEEHARLLGVFAGQAAIAIENTHLYAIARRQLREREHVDAELRAAHHFMQSALDALSSHIAILDEAGLVSAVNAAWRRFIEANASNMLHCGVGANYLDLCMATTGEARAAALAIAAGISAVMTGQEDEYALEYPCPSCRGATEQHWFLARATRFSGDGPVRIVVVHENITQRKLMEEALRKSEKQLAFQAYHDPLTALPNRALFLDRLERTLQHADQRPKLIVVLFIDLDGFKVINDNLGHAVGDQLLVAVATRLRACVRADNTVARLGGDEFTALLDNITDLKDAIAIAQRIIEDLQEPFIVDSYELRISSSIGIALSTLDGQRADELLRDADAALYQAKRTGKARYEVFAQDMRWGTRPLRMMQQQALPD